LGRLVIGVAPCPFPRHSLGAGRPCFGFFLRLKPTDVLNCRAGKEVNSKLPFVPDLRGHGVENYPWARFGHGREYAPCVSRWPEPKIACLNSLAHYRISSILARIRFGCYPSERRSRDGSARCDISRVLRRPRPARRRFRGRVGARSRLQASKASPVRLISADSSVSVSIMT
jgi:hypothetical protein